MRRASLLARSAANLLDHFGSRWQTNVTCALPAAVRALENQDTSFKNKSHSNIQRARFTTAPPSSFQPSDILEVTNAETFNSAVALSNTIPVILDAYAQWCGPCKQLDPVLKKTVAEQGGKIALAKMDIDTPALAPLVQQLQINSVPTLILLFGGRAVGIKQGAPPPAELKKWIAEAIDLAEAVSGAAGTKSQPEAEVADPKTLVQEGFDAARSPGAAIEKIAPKFASAMQSPAADAVTKAEATAGLALCAVLDGDFPTAKELIANAKAAAEQAQQAAPGTIFNEVEAVDAYLGLAEEEAAVLESDSRNIEDLQAAVDKEKKDLDALHALVLRLVTAGRLEEAGNAALQLVRRDREWKEQAGKQLVLKIADAMGGDSEAGKAVRRRLSNIWFI